MEHSFRIDSKKKSFNLEDPSQSNLKKFQPNVFAKPKKKPRALHFLFKKFMVKVKEVRLDFLGQLQLPLRLATKATQEDTGANRDAFSLGFTHRSSGWNSVFLG